MAPNKLFKPTAPPPAGPRLNAGVKCYAAGAQRATRRTRVQGDCYLVDANRGPHRTIRHVWCIYDPQAVGHAPRHYRVSAISPMQMGQVLVILHGAVARRKSSKGCELWARIAPPRSASQRSGRGVVLIRGNQHIRGVADMSALNQRFHPTSHSLRSRAAAEAWRWTQ